MPNNSVPYNQMIAFNTRENEADRPEVTVAVSPDFVNAPWLSEFLRRGEPGEVNSFLSF